MDVLSGLVMEVERELGPEDLAMLELTPTRSPSLKRIRDSHHALARLITSGMSNVEAGEITGFDPTYISVLKADPAFAELLAFYQDHEESVQASLRERMVLIALNVSQEIQDRILNHPEEIEFDSLRNMLKDMADRTGHGPTSTVKSQIDITETMTYTQKRDILEALDALAQMPTHPVIDANAIDLQPDQAGAGDQAGTSEAGLVTRNSSEAESGGANGSQGENPAGTGAAAPIRAVPGDRSTPP